MARIRYIKPSFFKDEDLAELPPQVRLFYAGLWTEADKAGRLEDRPKRLKAELFPYEEANTEEMLQLLSKPKASSKRPFIQRYEINGERYIQIVEWDEHQRPHHTEAESKIPPIPPLKRKEKGKEKGKEKQLNGSTELRNGYLTVKEQDKYPFLKDPSFFSIFNDFLKMRISIKHKATLKAQELVLNELHKYDLKTAVAMLEQSIMNSWRGVFPLKTKGDKNVKSRNDVERQQAGLAEKESRRRGLDALGREV